MNAQEIQAVVAAAVTAALEHARPHQAPPPPPPPPTIADKDKRKPTIPPFEPNDIETWVRRVKAAFARLSISDPKVKFACLDEKIPIGQDPILNDFMYNESPDEDSWKAFLAYLTDKHGRTKQQRAMSIIEGTDREGRTPSQLWSVMADKAGEITLDDVMKEQLMRRLPADVRQHLIDKGLDELTGKEVAKLADDYFTKDGKPKNKQNATDINAVGQTARQKPSSMKPPNRPPTQPPSRSASPASECSGFTSVFGDEEQTDVNAVRFKQGRRQKIDVNNRSQSRGRAENSTSRYNNNYQQSSRGRSYSSHSNSNNRGRFNNPQSANNNNDNTDVKNNVCYYHNKFGDKARTCAEGCMLYSKFESGKAKASH